MGSSKVRVPYVVQCNNNTMKRIIKDLLFASLGFSIAALIIGSALYSAIGLVLNVVLIGLYFFKK